MTEVGEQVVEDDKETVIIEGRLSRHVGSVASNRISQMLFRDSRLCVICFHESGSIYVHLDARISHYVQASLTRCSVQEIGNEIIWKRTTAHSDSTIYATVHDHDVLLLRKAMSTFGTSNMCHMTSTYVDDKYRYKDKNGRRFRLTT